MNYIEFAQKIKEKYPEYKDVDDLTLSQKIVEKYPEYKEKVTFEEVQKLNKKDLDLSKDFTPSGLAKRGAANISALLRMPIYKEDFQTAKDNARINQIMAERKHPALLGGLEFANDIATYSQLPVLRGTGAGAYIGNAAIQGGIPGAIEALKRDGNAVGGGAMGTGIASLLQSAPYIGKALGNLSSKGLVLSGKLAQLEPATIAQAIKPTSKALDLTKEQADRLALDTTERFRDAYKSLLNKKGDTVGNLLKELPEDKLYDAEALSNSYDSVLNSYGLSGNKALNPAKNAASKEMKKIKDLLFINESKKVNPKELYDINKNVNNMIDWDKPGSALKNDALEQIYLTNSRKISQISPELKAANKAYSDLMDYKGGRSRLRTILNPNTDIETATSKLKNYKSTNDNIFDLEKQLIKEEEALPFLSEIDDINAALDLLKKENTGLGGLSGIAKTTLTKPILRLVREANRREIPAKLKTIQEQLRGIGKPAPSIGAKAGANILYGGVEYNDYQ